jgi:hypothetical protein
MGRVGMGLKRGARRLRVGGSAPTPTPIAPPITAISALGYVASYNGTPPGYQPGNVLTMTRKGYDGSYTSPGGVPIPTLRTDVGETISVRHRVRNGYPDDGSEPVWSAAGVALSTYAYATDSAAGVTNGSAETSPKPTCGWAITDRRVVGNSINLQLVAFHRNARLRQQVACVVFSATDGTTTVHALVAASSVLTFPGGSQPFTDVRCEGFETDLDITSLSNNADITVNASAFPWIGDAASVAASNSANEYEFAPLVFRKNTAKAANPPLVYVATTGSDATVDANGVSGGITKVSTNAATARANAFLTVKSAVEALKAATNVTGGFTDGCEIRLVDGIGLASTAPAAGTYSQTAALTITRDPLSANRAAAALTVGSATALRQGWVRFTDLKYIRSANAQPTGAAKAFFENVDLDNGGFASPPLNAMHYWVGVTVTNLASSMWSAGGIMHNLIRGCTIASGAASRPEAGVCIGNKLSVAGSHALPLASATRQLDRMIVAFNKFTGISATGSVAIWSTLIGAYNNCAVVQNLFEYVSTALASIVHASGDGATFSLPGLVFTDNTFAGALNCGRINFLYDETIGTYRNQKLACVRRNVFAAWTTKSDYFIGLNGGANGAESVQHTGNHNVLYGVDVEENFCLWPDANAIGYGTDSLERRWGNYTPYTLGARSSRPNGAAGFVEFLNDARFKDFKATTYTPHASAPIAGSYTAGAGGGDYRPKRSVDGDAVNSPAGPGAQSRPPLRARRDGAGFFERHDRSLCLIVGPDRWNGAVCRGRWESRRAVLHSSMARE